MVNVALAAWPEHEKFLVKSFGQRTPETLDATEEAAAAVLRLMAGEDRRFGEDYHWTCDHLREEELFFHREGRYRLSTFAQALVEVYSDHDYMRRYMGGLLLTQILWYNHIATIDMFFRRVLHSRGSVRLPRGGPRSWPDDLFRRCSSSSRTLEVWDVSAVSLRETRAALDRLGVTKPYRSSKRMYWGSLATAGFDLVVISEVLEHLETPSAALRLLRSAIAEDGRVFINVPINSPSPDHLYLFSTPQEVVDLIEDSDLHIERMELYATQGRTVERALANRISVSAGVIARLR